MCATMVFAVHGAGVFRWSTTTEITGYGMDLWRLETDGGGFALSAAMRSDYATLPNQPWLRIRIRLDMPTPLTPNL
jgi:hypothetical protein